MSGKLLSIVIPVKDDVEIFKLLEQTQRYQSEQIEVIVIANGSQASFVRNISRLLVGVKSHLLVCIPKADIAAARNAGIELSVSEYILFLDSDCRLPPNYLDRVIGYLGHKKGMFIGRGAVNFIPRGHLFSKLNSIIRNRSYSRHKNACYAPNLVVSSSIFARIGGFCPGIGYGVDTEWGRRAELHGYSIEHLPGDFIVDHVDDSSALKTVKTWFCYGVGRAFREKRNYLLGRCGRFDYLKSLFPSSNLVDREDSPIFAGFVVFHYFVRTLGVLYGILFRWRKVNRRFLEKMRF